MDWLIDSTDIERGSVRARALLSSHLRRHAVDPEVAEVAVTRIARELDDRVASADGRPLRLSLDWTAPTPVLEVAAVRDVDAPARDDVPTGQAVPARQRALVRSWERDEPVRLELDVPRRARTTFDAGPPPVLNNDLDPEAQGAATVALALMSAMQAHPSASPEQAATIAGSLIAAAGVTDAQLDAHAVAETFVRLHGVLGSDAHVVAADDRTVELAVSKCPFLTGSGGSPLCHLSTGLAGQLGARVHGAATVVLDEAIAAGDPECHLQVLLSDAEGEIEGESYYWPPRAFSPLDAVPHLDLSVSLPRESVSVPVVRRLAAQALRAFGVHEDDVDDVQLAITEACANVIDHAAETDTYDVKVELAANRCAISVIDQGGGFDAATVPARAEDDAEMGRGLALMRALVDNVAFRNEPQAGAVVHMVKALEYEADHPLHRR